MATFLLFFSPSPLPTLSYLCKSQLDYLRTWSRVPPASFGRSAAGPSPGKDRWGMWLWATQLPLQGGPDLPRLWYRHFTKCVVCSLVGLVFSVLPGKFVILAPIG